MIYELAIILSTPLSAQLAWLLLLSIPIACVAWTVTHEEVFSEPRDYCSRKYQGAQTIVTKKFFYLFTCEYCFSHYVTAVFLVITHFHLLFADWRGYLIGGFALVWVANVYMSLFGLIRIDLKKEKTQVKKLEGEL